MTDRKIDLVESSKKIFTEKTGCFRERFNNFLYELEIEAQKQFPHCNQSRKKLVAMLEILEEAGVIIKKEKEKIKEALIALVGFDIEGTGKLPVYKERKVEIDDSPTAYACTDESISSFF